VTELILNLVLVRLEMLLVLVQDSCTIYAEHTLGSISFWTHPMVLLRDEAHVEARFGLFRDSANLDARSVHGLRRTYHRLKNYFGLTQWNS
jgi:hypothetical protein